MCRRFHEGGLPNILWHLYEGGLQLRNERLEENSPLVDEQSECQQDGRLDSVRETIPHDADERACASERWAKEGELEEGAVLGRRTRGMCRIRKAYLRKVTY